MILIDVRQPVEVAYEGPCDEHGKLIEDRKLPEGEFGWYLLRPLSAQEYARLFTEMGRPGGAESLVAAVGKCLRGWRNVKDANGAEIPFPGSGGKALEILPGDLVAQIGRKLVGISQLDKADRAK